MYIKFIKGVIMKLVFSNQVPPQSISSSIFLAGPTPRTKDVTDWRKEAVAILESLNYKGVVFIPCPDFVWEGENSAIAEFWDYDSQVAWELEYRHMADKIVFWIPRDIQGGMPGFTTNIEFGEDMHSFKMIYGRPANAEKCRYMDKRLEVMGMPIFDNLEVMLSYTVDKLGSGSVRVDGETNIPLHIWLNPSFQTWYQNLRKSENILLDAEVTKTHVINDKVFAFSLWVSIFIKEEGRIKKNEVIFSRPDISTVVAYFENDNKEDPYVVLIKEFRSNVNNSASKVFELPGGSSLNILGDPLTVAQHELFEEVGLFIKDVNRFKKCGVRQMASTFTTFRNHMYSINLTKEEFEQLKEFSANGTYFGEGEEEKTQIVIKRLSELLKDENVDCSMIGALMIAIKS